MIDRIISKDEALALDQQLVYWSPPDRAYTPRILCMVIDVDKAYGRWILTMIPVAGDGLLKGSAAHVELCHRQDLDPRWILDDFSHRHQAILTPSPETS